MNRPPATRWERFEAFPNAGADPIASVAFLGVGLHMQAIYFENGGNFVATPSDPDPAGGPLPSLPVLANTLLEISASSIDPSTTALPFWIFWGPLGVGAR